MLQDILKEFEELVDELEIKVTDFRGNNVPDLINDFVTLIVSGVRKQIKQDYKDFITNTYNTARKELVEEILDEIPEAGGIEVTNNAGEKTLMFNGFIDRQEIITLLNKKI